MVLEKRSAISLVACALSVGCTAVTHPEQMVEVAILTTYNDPLIEGKVILNKSSAILPVGYRSADNSTFFQIRECNAGHSHCADAVVKPVVSYMVQNLRDRDVTISVNVSYDAGRGQSIETRGLVSSMSSSITIDPNADVITGHSTVSRTASVKLGEIRKIPLPNGVALDVCVALPGANGLSQQNGCDFSVIETDPRVQGAVKLL